MRERIDRANVVSSVSLRSFFLNLSGTESEIESELEKLIGSKEEPQVEVAVAASKYVRPESQHSLEPDHLHLDAFIFGAVSAHQVGRLVKWLADDLDEDPASSDDDYAWLVRPEVARIYEVLLGRVIEVAWPGMRLEVKPWPLSRLGKFKDRGTEADRISIWFVSSDLSDKLTGHIVRDISTVPVPYTSIRDELRGLSQLRNDLRRSWKTNRTRPRKRHFLITGSVRLSKPTGTDQIEREFDGGILQLSSRTGPPRLYLLETKGAQTPAAAANRLTEKLGALGLRGEVVRLRSHSAYAVLKM